MFEIPTKRPFSRDSDICIVAGNGPSLAEIDYKKMPQNADIFRCNQFYFEPKYYLGKRVKGCFFSAFLQQYFTARHLVTNDEYSIDFLLCDSSWQDRFISQKEFALHFPETIFYDEYMDLLSELAYYRRFNELFYEDHFTTGINMCAFAIAAGYKEIYIAGIDLYEKGINSYAFGNKQPNLNVLLPALQKLNHTNTESDWHNAQTDLNALEFLQKYYNARFFSLCPNSPLSQHIPLAPDINTSFCIESKPENYTKDLIIPPLMNYNYHGFKKPMLKPLKQDSQSMHEKIDGNFYLKLIKDLFKLPSALKFIYKKYIQIITLKRNLKKCK